MDLLELVALGFENLEAGLKGAGVARGAGEGGEGGQVTDFQFWLACKDF